MIEPYASGRRWRLYAGDVLRVLPALHAEGLRVDGTITDPPYSSGGQFRGDRAGDTNSKYLSSNSKQAAYLPQFGGDNRDQRSLERWLGWVFADLLALAKPGAVLACSMDWRNAESTAAVLDVGTLAQAGGWTMRGIMPWVKKGGGRPQMGRWAAAAEYVLWASAGPLDDRARAVLGCLPGYLLASPPSDREHTTEKPSLWGDWLVSGVMPEGVVLDPFTGSGSVGEAALRSGRSFVGVEVNPEYLAIAARRLAQAEHDGQPQALLMPVAQPTEAAPNPLFPRATP